MRTPIAVALVALAVAAPAAGREQPRCGSAPGRTLIRNHSGRVYLTHQAILVCAKGARRARGVGAQWAPQVSSSGGGGVLRVALNGGRVAFTEDQFESFGFDYANVLTFRLAQGHLGFRHTYGGEDTTTRDARIADLALCAGGQAAFIGGYDAPAGPQYEVRISSGRDAVVLDAGPGVDPGSLRAGPGRISWTRSGVPQQALTTCERPVASVPVSKLSVDDVLGGPG